MNEGPDVRWYHEEQDQFRDALTLAQAVSGFSARLIEKDYYCSLVLHDLAVQFQLGLVFKGGTCLSKVHAEFFRMSEDLDFALPLDRDASRSERRGAAAPIKDHLGGVTVRLACFELADPLAAHNDCRQYNGRLAYRSVVTGEREFIKVEVSLREPIVLPSVVLPARTLLRNPESGQSALPPVSVRVLALLEAYAEKIRAALTRREPAIRDYFDIDDARRRALFDPADRALLDLVAAKLSVAGNEHVDLSDDKIITLREQIEPQLRPVLRSIDFDEFDLERVIDVLRDIVRQC